MKGTATGTITIKKCSVVPKILKKDYKSASGATGTLANGGAITWKGGETTIVGLPTVTLGGTACPAGSNEATGTSTVVGGTATLTPVGDTVVVSVCISAKGKVSLAPGTQVQL